MGKQSVLLADEGLYESPSPISLPSLPPGMMLVLVRRSTDSISLDMIIRLIFVAIESIRYDHHGRPLNTFGKRSGLDQWMLAASDQALCLGFSQCSTVGMYKDCI